MSRPYNSTFNPDVRHSRAFSDSPGAEAAYPTGPLHTVANTEPPKGGKRNLYWRLSDMVGFKEKYSLIWFILFGGSLLGFCLFSMTKFSPSRLERVSLPGEWFWYRKPLYKPNVFIHTYLTTIGCLLTGVQFLPAYQTAQWMTFHRVNGWIILILLVPGTITGAIISRFAWGGSVSTQAALYLVSIMILYACVAGMYDLNTPGRHRRWMLRMMSYLGTIITALIIRHIAGQIITHVGTYYSVWLCDEIKSALGDNSPILKQDYPECLGSAVHALVKADINGHRANYASAVRCSFGMAFWVALSLHTIGVEIYIRYTPVTNRVHNNAPHQYVGSQVEQPVHEKH